MIFILCPLNNLNASSPYQNSERSINKYNINKYFYINPPLVRPPTALDNVVFLYSIFINVFFKYFYWSMLASAHFPEAGHHVTAAGP